MSNESLTASVQLDTSAANNNLEKLNASVEKLLSTFESAASSITSSLDKVGGSVGELATGLDTQTATITEGFTSLNTSLGSVEQGLGGVSEETSAVGNSVESTNSSTRSFIATLVIARSVFDSLQSALTNFTQTAATQMDVASSFAQQFGDTTSAALNQLRSAARGTVSDLDLMKTANKASLEGISSNINDIAGVMEVARQRAHVLGEDTSKVFRELVDGISKGSTAGEQLAKSLGIDLPANFKTAANTLDLAQQKQLMLNLTLKTGQEYIDKYGQVQMTASDRMAQFASETQNTQEALGVALLPALEAIQNDLRPFLELITQIARSNPEVIQGVVGVGLAVSGLVTSILLLNAVTPGVMSFFGILEEGELGAMAAAGPLAIALVAIGMIFASYVGNEMKAAMDNLNEGMADLGKNSNNTSDTITDGFGQAQQKLDDLRQSIAEENAAFEAQAATLMKQREDDLKNSRETLDQQEKDFIQKQKAMEDAYNKKVVAQKKQNDTALADLATSLGKSVLVGSSTYAQDLANYTAAVDAEKEANVQKLEEIQTQHEQEVTDAKQKYDEKTNKLKEKIAEDEAFLQRHAEFQYLLNSDIQRDELDKLEETHTKRLASIQTQYEKELAMNKTLNAGIINNGADTSGKLKDMWNGVSIDIGAIFKEGLQKMLNDAGNSLKNFFKGFMDLGVAVGESINQLFNHESNSQFDANIAAAGDAIDKAIPTYASGTDFHQGGLAMVGENGPELVNLPRGSVVHNNSQTTNMMNSSGVTNIYVDPSTDLDVLSRKLQMQYNFK